MLDKRENEIIGKCVKSENLLQTSGVQEENNHFEQIQFL